MNTDYYPQSATPMKFIFVTRYSVYAHNAKGFSLARSLHEAEYKAHLFSNKRLLAHQHLFFTRTLPSLAAQKPALLRNTIHYVFTSTELPPVYMQSLEMKVRQYPFVKLVALPPNNASTALALRKELEQLPKNTIFASIMLDDDDAVANTFLDQLSRYVHTAFAGMAISFGKGVALITEHADNKETSRTTFYEIISPFVSAGLAYINARHSLPRAFVNDTIATILDAFVLRGHRKIHRKLPCIVDSRQRAFLKSIHEESQQYFIKDNKRQKEYKNENQLESREILSDFSIVGLDAEHQTSDETNKRSDTLDVFFGRVSTGKGLSSRHMSRGKLDYASILGYKPFPGTLNLKTGKKTARSIKQNSNGLSLQHDADTIVYYPARIHSLSVHVIAYKEGVEVLAPVNLREYFQLKDGALVEVCL
jgi:CTP-dependent riboflavin kinase